MTTPLVACTEFVITWTPRLPDATLAGHGPPAEHREAPAERPAPLLGQAGFFGIDGGPGRPSQM
jgi:hypothetical protein